MRLVGLEMRTGLLRILVAVCALVANCSSAISQPKPSLGLSSTHIFPAGGRRGTEFSVAVGAECAAPGTHFLLDSTCVSVLKRDLDDRLPSTGERSARRTPTEKPITYPKQWASRLSIAKDAPLGPVYWRLRCAQGGTCSRPFLIGDLPGFVETESNSTLAVANPIALPVTVNGQINGERDVDYYRFLATEGDVVSCEVIARRLGSPLDPNLAILNDVGKEVPVERRYVGDDVVIAMATPSQFRFRATGALNESTQLITETIVTAFSRR